MTINGSKKYFCLQTLHCLLEQSLEDQEWKERTSLENLSNLAIQWHRATQGKWPEFTPTKSPVQVTVTGAAGQIGYALLFRVASGEMLGPDQPVILRCLELPNAMNALEGVKMELNDCAFPLLKNVVCTSDPEEAFDGTDMAVYSNGSYGATKGIYFSYPIVCEGGEYTIVQNVPIDPYSAQKIEASHKELLQERDAVSAYLKN